VVKITRAIVSNYIVNATQMSRGYCDQVTQAEERENFDKSVSRFVSGIRTTFHQPRYCCRVVALQVNNLPNKQVTPQHNEVNRCIIFEGVDGNAL